jgi:hypothetical protein
MFHVPSSFLLKAIRITFFSLLRLCEWWTKGKVISVHNCICIMVLISRFHLKELRFYHQQCTFNTFIWFINFLSDGIFPVYHAFVCNRYTLFWDNQFGMCIRITDTIKITYFHQLPEVFHSTVFYWKCVAKIYFCSKVSPTVQRVPWVCFPRHWYLPMV